MDQKAFFALIPSLYEKMLAQHLVVALTTAGVGRPHYEIMEEGELMDDDSVLPLEELMENRSAMQELLSTALDWFWDEREDEKRQ